MNNCLKIRWEKKDYLARLIRGDEKKIKKYKKKLNNPVNQKTGNPLATSTVKQYKMCMSLLEREVKNLKDFQNYLLKVDMGDNEIFPMPWRKHIFDIARNGHQPFCENLIDIKTSISNSTFFCHHDLINMAKFVFNYKKYKKPGDLASSIIISSFNDLLDHLIDENMEKQLPPKSEVVNLFPSIEDRIDRLDKLITEAEWKQSKIFSSEPIKKKSKCHLRVVK